MAVLKIYSGSTGMQQSLAQIEQRIAAELAQASSVARPRDAVSMLAAEQEHQARGRRIGDFLSARDIVQAHLDLIFINQSLRAGRERLRAEGARRIKSCGWCWTRIELRGGLVVKLQTPYLRRSYEGRKGRRRAKRGKAGGGLYPLLWKLGFEHQLSAASRSEIARQSVLCASYEEASEQMGRQGLALSAQSVGHVAVQVGRRGLELRDQSVRAALRAPLLEHSSLAGKRVRICLDGGRARTRQSRRGRGIRPGDNGRRPFRLHWNEPRVLTLDVLDEHGEVDRTLLPLYETGVRDADSMMELVAGTLRLVGVHLASEVLFVADAAEWIWRRVVNVLLDEVGVEPARLFIALDYYHVTEHIAEALGACKTLRAEAREALRHELCSMLLQPGGAECVIERLRSLARGRRARLINGTIGYLQERLELLDYADLRARRLSIGSGVVESAVRRIINLRFKSASMCWRVEHLEPLLYLRAILKAGRWDQFFQALLLERHWLDPSCAFGPSSKPSRVATRRLCANA